MSFVGERSDAMEHTFTGAEELVGMSWNWLQAGGLQLRIPLLMRPQAKWPTMDVKTHILYCTTPQFIPSLRFRVVEDWHFFLFSQDLKERGAVARRIILVTRHPSERCDGSSLRETCNSFEFAEWRYPWENQIEGTLHAPSTFHSGLPQRK